MKCPIDGVDLQMSERQNVEIDFCPKCRGVWLDRGELDKIIDKAEKDSPVISHKESKQYYSDDDYKYKKRKSWIGEIFD